MNPPMTGAEAARTPGSGVRAAPLPTGVVALLDGLGAVALLTRDAVHAALRRPPEWSTIAEQLEQVGWRSLSIVNLTAFFTGMVLALQLGTYMARQHHAGEERGQVDDGERAPADLLKLLGDGAPLGRTAERGVDGVAREQRHGAEPVEQGDDAGRQGRRPHAGVRRARSLRTGHGRVHIDGGRGVSNRADPERAATLCAACRKMPWKKKRLTSSGST